MRPLKAFMAGVLVTILVPLATALLVFKMGWVSVNADAKPGWIERELAEMSLDASVARNAPRTENPVVQNEQNLKTAVTLYKDNCAGCHGGSQGPSDFGLSFYPPAPQFVNRKRPFGASDGELFYITKHGIRLTGMPAFGSETGKPMLKDDEIWSIVRFLKTMHALPPAVAEEWQGHSASPTPQPSSTPASAPSPTVEASTAPSPAASAVPDDADES